MAYFRGKSEPGCYIRDKIMIISHFSANPRDKVLITDIKNFQIKPEAKSDHQSLDNIDRLPRISNLASKLGQIGPRWDKYGTF